MRRKVLIHKTGRRETFAPSEVSLPSLGDVVRATVLLHAFRDDDVTWVTSPEAMPLLADHPAIARLVAEGESLSPDDHDLVLDLENPGAAIGARETWQQALFRLIGREWRGEEYWLGEQTLRAAQAFPPVEIGLNWAVGAKWPAKAWDMSHWRELRDRLAPDHSVSWQRGFNCLDEYVAWIAACDLIVTTDSLGLHLALALRKKVVALFGPTPSHQVYFYGRGTALSAEASQKAPCVDMISVEEVRAAVTRISAKVVT
jgi:heptosyltransferase-2